YAHEQIVVRNGTAFEFLQRVYERGAAVGSRFGWELAGAWKTAMVDDDECILLWAIPTWQHWADFEKVQRSDAEVQAWRTSVRDIVESWQRIVLVDAPLSPFRTGRQPSRSDRSMTP
ncbi:MAG: NIPSNAP family containing protein, partial [Acidimicrobiia bacterium]|nr:NIPSNAP family containing protein [Acidimicrobiia bacterium]